MSFKMLKVSEAAEQASISRRSLDRQIKQGTGPAVIRLGGAVRVRSDELQAWLERCTVQRHSTSAGAV